MRHIAAELGHTYARAITIQSCVLLAYIACKVVGRSLADELDGLWTAVSLNHHTCAIIATATTLHARESARDKSKRDRETERKTNSQRTNVCV